MNFNDYEWHDAIIKKIKIDRNDPGNKDVVEFEILWPDGTLCRMTFVDVYWCNLLLNFGIVASESILTAYMNEDDNDVDLQRLFLIWKNKIGHNVHCFFIETNSTASTIKIIARDFTCVDMPS